MTDADHPLVDRADPDSGSLAASSLAAALSDVDRPFALVARGRGLEVTPLDPGESPPTPYRAFVPAGPVRNLGDASFRHDHGLRYAYVGGAMANGIASEALVEALAHAGMLGFFGAAGLAPDRVEAAIDRLSGSLGDLPHGYNLIHSPYEPEMEAAVADLFLRRGVRLVEASAYLDLTLPLIRYRVVGIHRDAEGRVVVPNRVVAKASRVEVATKFMSPPPPRFLEALVVSGDITAEQAALAASIPVADDLTAEADSGGHTDNRPALALLPALLALRDRLQAEHAYARPLRVGAAGGIATPAAAAAAFAMGAGWVLTGSINQACLESGTSDTVRTMLAETEQADVIMAPAADMFEMGVKVQVCKRGTMFPMRAARLFELYRAHDSLEALPAAERDTLERKWFRASFDQVWAETQQFFAGRDPERVARAAENPKQKMALVFKWYLGQSSRWANAGDPSRRVDYQIWCGPAMGAFNEWARGSCLEPPAARDVATVGMNILHGAAVLARVNALRMQGIVIPPEAARVAPRPRAELEPYLTGSNRLTDSKGIRP